MLVLFFFFRSSFANRTSLFQSSNTTRLRSGSICDKKCDLARTVSSYFSVDTYASHERKLYCKVHHKMLFKPKAVEEKEEQRGEYRSAHQLRIIISALCCRTYNPLTDPSVNHIPEADINCLNV